MSSKWKVEEMKPVKFISAKATAWERGEDSGEKLGFIFEDQDGNRVYDGFWFKKGMGKKAYETTFRRARHMVNVVKKSGWKDAGKFEGDALEFLQKVADQCNHSKGHLFYLKTLFVLYKDGRKVPKFGKSVRFIAPYVNGESLVYSGEEEENPMYVLENC